MAEGEKIAQETISDLRLQLENSKINLESCEIVSENLKIDLSQAEEKVRALEGFLGSDRIFPVGVKNLTGKGDDGNSSEISSDTGCSSFVVVGDGEDAVDSKVINQSQGHGHGQVQSRIDGTERKSGMNRGERVVLLESDGSTGDTVDGDRERKERRSNMLFDSTNSISGSGSDQDPLLSAQASLVSELQDRYKDAVDEVRMMRIMFLVEKIKR